MRKARTRWLFEVLDNVFLLHGKLGIKDCGVRGTGYGDISVDVTHWAFGLTGAMPTSELRIILRTIYEALKLKRKKNEFIAIAVVITDK